MYHFFVDVEQSAGQSIDRYLVVELPSGETLQSLFERIYREVETEERLLASIIVRPPVKYQLSPELFKDQNAVLTEDVSTERLRFLEELRQEPLSTVFSRFDDTVVRVLYSYDFGHYLSDNLNPMARQYTDIAYGDAFLIDAICQMEMDFLVESGKCKLPPLESQYYRVPSSRHVRSFLRVGSLQTSRAAIDAIFFWLLPYLRDCVGVITDTWSISSISQNISRRLVEYDNECTVPCPIEMLGDYHHNKETYGEEAADIIDRFLNRVAQTSERQGKVLILISATHTGSMYEIVQKQMNRRGIDSELVRFVILFRLSGAIDLPALRDYSDVPDFRPVDEPVSREQSESAIEIDGTIYFPTSEIDVETGKTLEAMKPYERFAKRYTGIPFARVHYTDEDSNPNQPRHHMVWLDMKRIQTHPTFLQSFKAKLNALVPKPAVIICPTHPAAKSLAELARQHFKECGSDVPVYEHDDLKLDVDLIPEERVLADALSNLYGTQAILLIDDVFVTGVRMTVYQKNLRTTECGAVMHALVGVARPQRDKVWNVHRTTFLRAAGPRSVEQPWPNTFDFVEYLVLPNWGEADCPWCNEAAVVDKSRYQLSLATCEAECRDGLINNIFAVPNGHSALALRRDSYFGSRELSQSSVYCLVSGMLQTLRTQRFGDAPMLGTKQFLLSVVLSYSVYRSHYTDSILVASFFRAVKNVEFVYRNKGAENDRTREIESLIKESSNADLLSEFVLACLRGKFPSVDLEEERWQHRLINAGILPAPAGSD